MKKAQLLFIFLVFNLLSFAQNKQNQFRAGDILFQDLDCGPLCDAIEAVTEGFQGKDFSHVGIVIEKKKELFVIEAIGAKVRSTPLKDFLARSLDSQNQPKVLGARMNQRYQKLNKKACKNAIQMVGIPYDNRFLLNNDSLYCSELIYDVFKNANNGIPVFEMQAMTYKQPNSQNYFQAWIDYYKDLKSNIPEGELGINPGLISRSANLQIFYQYGKWINQP